MLLPEGRRAGGGSGVPFAGYFFLSPEPLVTRGLVLLLLNPRQSTPRLALVFCGLCSSPAALPWGGSELLWCRGSNTSTVLCIQAWDPSVGEEPGFAQLILRSVFQIILVSHELCAGVRTARGSSAKTTTAVGARQY